MNNRFLLALLALPLLAVLTWAQIKPGTLTAPPTQLLRYSTVIYETEFYGLRRNVPQPAYGVLYPGGSRPDQIYEANRSQRRIDIAFLQAGIRTRGTNGWHLQSMTKINEDGGKDELLLVFERGKPMP